MNNDSKNNEEKDKFKKEGKDKVKKAFLNRSLSFYENRVEINSDYNQVATLIRIKELVDEIIPPNGVQFSVVGEEGKKAMVYKKPLICKKIVLYFRKPFLIHEIAKTFPIHVFHPYIELFLKNFNETVMKIEQDIHHKNHDEFITNKTHLFNEFIDNIRTEAGSKQFKTKVNNYQRLQNKNNKSLNECIDNLYNRYAHLIIVKADFSHKKEMHNRILNEDQRKEQYYKIKIHRKSLIKSMRTNPIFDHLVGYVWKLEYSIEKGFHLHMNFIFDGSKIQQDVNMAMLIGDHWKTTITAGTGLCFNLNAHMGRYRDRGIDVIPYDNPVQREELEKTVLYLTKSDYYMRLVAPDNGRTFGKGEIKAKTSNRGRP